MVENEEELKRLLIKVKKESKKAGLKFSIQKLRSWHPVLSFHGKQMGKTVSDFIFLGFKINVDNDYNHRIKRHLLLERGAVTNLRQRHPFANKVRIVKAMAFPVVTYGCKSWTVKKAKRQRTDTFELWCWRKLLRVPWTARRSNQSILEKINTEYSLEGLMLKVKLQYFGHPIRRADSWEMTLMQGKIEGKRIREGQRIR